jgi:hypothetical protein
VDLCNFKNWSEQRALLSDLIMPPKEERVRIGDLVRRTVARIMMAPPETLAAGIQLLETRGNELAAEWSEKITKQKDPKSLFTAYSVESNMRLQIQRNSRSLVSAYLPVLRSGSIDPLSSTLYLIVSQRVELDFSIEEMLNVFFMFIGLISAAAGGDGAVQDLAVQLTLLTTIIVMEHHRSLTVSVEEEDVLAVTGDSMKLSCDEFQKLVKQYEDLNDTETVKVPATCMQLRARAHAHSRTHARTHTHKGARRVAARVDVVCIRKGGTVPHSLRSQRRPLPTAHRVGGYGR